MCQTWVPCCSLDLISGCPSKKNVFNLSRLENDQQTQFRTAESFAITASNCIMGTQSVTTSSQCATPLNEASWNKQFAGAIMALGFAAMNLSFAPNSDSQSSQVGGKPKTSMHGSVPSCHSFTSGGSAIHAHASHSLPRCATKFWGDPLPQQLQSEKGAGTCCAP